MRFACLVCCLGLDLFECLRFGVDGRYVLFWLFSSVFYLLYCLRVFWCLCWFACVVLLTTLWLSLFGCEVFSLTCFACGLWFGRLVVFGLVVA